MKTHKLTITIALLLISIIGFSQTTNYVPRYNSGGTLENSIIYQSTNTPARIGIGTTAPASGLHLDAGSTLNIARFTNAYGGGDLELVAPSTYLMLRNRMAGKYMYFCTTNSQGSANSYQLFLDADGNVGIRKDPSTSFEVYNGTLKISGTMSRSEEDARFVMDMSSSTAHKFMEIRNNFGTQFSISGDGRVGIRVDDPTTTLDINNGTLRIAGTDGLSEETARFVMDMGTATTQRFIELRNSTGSNFVINGNFYVGIGTNTPTSKLHVKGGFEAIKYEPTLISGSNFVFDLDFYDPSTSTDNWTIRNHINDPEKGKSLMFWSKQGAPLIIVGDNVKLGVGTSAPTARLEVKDGVLKISGSNNLNQGDARLIIDTENTSSQSFIQCKSLGVNQFVVDNTGKVYAREVEVTLSTFDWPDYVFEDSYNLMSIDELKLFVESNKHLPGVPSAEDVNNDGLNIGEMNAELLRKIEELTLYIIQQNERINELQSQIDQLNKN